MKTVVNISDSLGYLKVILTPIVCAMFAAPVPLLPTFAVPQNPTLNSRFENLEIANQRMALGIDNTSLIQYFRNLDPPQCRV
jgi:hypothetical protein